MIKKKYAIILFLSLSVECIFAQCSFQCKFANSQRNKKLIKNSLYSINNHAYSGRNFNIMYYSDTYTDIDVLLPDSICGSFVITKIVKKKNNYILKKGLIKQSIYLLDVICITQEESPSFLNVIIPKYEYPKLKFKVGDTLRETIYPLFWRDRFLIKHGDSVYTSLPSLANSISFVFCDVWIENLKISYRNYFFLQHQSESSNTSSKRKHSKHNITQH